jgi:protein TonB
VKTVVPPPPEQPPVVFDTPSPVAVQAPPPAPPAPSVQADFAASVDISGMQLNPPKYPPQEQQDCVGGTVMLLVEIDASGNVLNVSVEKSSRNRNLDHSATEAAHHWRFNPGSRGGQKVGGTVRVPVQFTSPC